MRDLLEPYPCFHPQFQHYKQSRHSWELDEGNFNYHDGSNGGYLSIGKLNLKTREVVLVSTNSNIDWNFWIIHHVAELVTNKSPSHE